MLAICRCVSAYQFFPRNPETSPGLAPHLCLESSLEHLFTSVLRQLPALVLVEVRILHSGPSVSMCGPKSPPSFKKEIQCQPSQERPSQRTGLPTCFVFSPWRFARGRRQGMRDTESIPACSSLAVRIGSVLSHSRSSGRRDRSWRLPCGGQGFRRLGPRTFLISFQPLPVLSDLTITPTYINYYK